MDFLRFNFFCYLSTLIAFAVIVCGDIESNLLPGSDMRVHVLYPNILGRRANLNELAVTGSDCEFWFTLSVKYLIVTTSQSSVSLLLVVPDRG